MEEEARFEDVVAEAQQQMLRIAESEDGACIVFTAARNGSGYTIGQMKTGTEDWLKLMLAVAMKDLADELPPKDALMKLLILEMPPEQRAALLNSN